MKRLFLLLLGLTPLAWGFAYALMEFIMYPASAFLYPAASVLFFLFWGLFGFLSPRLEKKPIRAVLICNLPACTALLLGLYQGVVSKAYLPETLGLAVQLFFLPAFSLTFTLESYAPFRRGGTMWETYLVSFALMAAVFLCGYCLSAAVHRRHRCAPEIKDMMNR